MRVIIPMAGAGRGFCEAGYDKPKPMINVRGKYRTMFWWATRCLPSWNDVVLVGRMGTQPMVWLEESFTTCVVPGPTEGAACTVLAAAVGMPPDEPIAVMNCDQVFKADLAAIEQRCLDRGDDGFILTFTVPEDDSPRWSYVDADIDGLVSRVAEKTAISDQGTVGFYWFRRARDLVWAIATSIHLDRRVNGEFYLCPVFQHLIDRGQVIRAVPAEWFHGLGTPEDVRAFEALETVPL